MQCINGESIKSAVAKRIEYMHEQLGITKPRMYKERTIKGMEKPCFFIWAMDVSQTNLMRGAVSRDYQMNIRYHVEGDDKRLYEKLCDMGVQLLDYLRDIYLDLPIRGEQMSYEVTEGVLQVYVTYRIRLKKLEDKQEMNDLEINNKVK
jgi:hypothetical protein